MSDECFYPVFLNLRGKRVVVIGAGRVAARKLEGLLETGAELFVVGPTADARITEWARQGALTNASRPYEEKDLTGAALVFAATDNDSLNAAIVQTATRLNIPVNSATDPENGALMVPARLRRGHFCLAIGTDGRSPALARALRQQLESEYDEAWGQAVELLAEAREAIRQRVTEIQRRREIINHLATPQLVIELKRSGPAAARQALWSRLNEELGEAASPVPEQPATEE